MAGQLGHYRLSNRPIELKGPFTDNSSLYLSELFNKNAQNASNHLVRLFSANHGFPSFEGVLNDFGVEEYEDDTMVRWEVLGSSLRNIPLVEARDEDGGVISDADGDNAGRNGSPFYLVFEDEYFEEGEWVVGNLNEAYPMQIIASYKEGNKSVCKVVLNGRIDGGIPRERLLRGERFSLEGTYVEKEFSRGVGNVRLSSPMAMRTGWTRMRFKAEMSGKQIYTVMRCKIPVTVLDKATGKRHEKEVSSWAQYVLWEAEQQFAQLKNQALVYGQSNMNPNGEFKNYGKSGGVIETGAGLFEQMSYGGHVHYYNDFDIDMLTDIIDRIFAEGNHPMSESNIQVHTGRWGAKLFNKAVQDKVSGWTAFQYNGDTLGVLSRAKSDIHRNALRAGYQFTEYIAPNNIHVTLFVNNVFDDPVRNKLMHPEGGTVESRTFCVLDLGGEGDKNICKMRIKGPLGDPSHGFQSGFRNPFTGANHNDHMSWDIDSATWHIMETFSIRVKDPTRTLLLRDARLACVG